MKQPRMVAAGVVAIFWICLSCTAVRELQAVKDGAIWVIHDRHRAAYELIFICGPEGLLVQKAGFPGYRDRSFYGATSLTDESRVQLDEGLRFAAEVTPPFPPPGPYYSRFVFPADPAKDPEISFFHDENEPLLRWLLALEAAWVREENRLKHLPDWIANDPRLTRHLGIVY